MRKKPRFHSLKKIRVRQDWSRWTLYNLSRLGNANLRRTYFQQKWSAKSETRAYHGEHIREKMWKRMFRRNLPAVVPMDYKYLARNDGSEQAAGRGAGQDSWEAEGKRQKSTSNQMTPYMQMTYYPLERRLDTAIFRALFASSVRQARQFCVHGLVKVNGKKMVYPGYMLNPGDMFQVDPEMVMYATGAPKKRTRRQRKNWRSSKATKASEWKGPSNPDAPIATKVPLLASEGFSSRTQTSESASQEPTPEDIKKSLQDLLSAANVTLEAKETRAKYKQNLREFRKEVKAALSKWRSSSTPQKLATLEEQLSFIKQRFSPESTETKEDEASATELALSPENEKKLQEIFNRLREESEGFAPESRGAKNAKPYAIPWRPRDYMSAFAFIPRYLEVNQKVCAAVYLRHPVARPGVAEVPTPFSYEMSQLAFNWYLKRR